MCYIMEKIYVEKANQIDDESDLDIMISILDDIARSSVTNANHIELVQNQYLVLPLLPVLQTITKPKHILQSSI